MEKYSQVIFDKNTVEFVTVAAEFCGFLERARDMKRYDFVDTALKILPLLYLKATLLPPCEPIGEDEPETFVTEEDYELIRRAIAGVLGAKDDYLKCSCRIWCTVTRPSKNVFQRIWQISIRI